jgi:hypothetical protein
MKEHKMAARLIFVVTVVCYITTILYTAQCLACSVGPTTT